MLFDRVEGRLDEKGRRRLDLHRRGQPVFIPCDEVLLAVGQQNAFPWIEQDIGLKFTSRGLPLLDEITHQSTLDKVFFGGDAAFGPRNVITAVAQGHQAAISIHLFCQGKDLQQAAPPQGQSASARRWASMTGSMRARSPTTSARSCRWSRRSSP